MKWAELLEKPGGQTPMTFDDPNENPQEAPPSQDPEPVQEPDEKGEPISAGE